MGCVTAAIGGANCGGSATGAVPGELISDLAHNGVGLDKEKSATLGRYAALASSLVMADNDYRKFIHPVLGYEVVLDENDKIVTNPVNAGTYNFYNPVISNIIKDLEVKKESGEIYISDDKLHEKYDVDPYFYFGNAKDDTSSKIDRYSRVIYWIKLNSTVICIGTIYCIVLVLFLKAMKRFRKNNFLFYTFFQLLLVTP